MNDLQALYQEVILDHNKSPRNFRAMADATNVEHRPGGIGVMQRAGDARALCRAWPRRAP